MKKKPMLQCTNNTSGVMGLTLSQLGLFLATGILLAAVVSFVFFNSSQRANELRSFATDFSMLLNDMETQFIENTTRFQFPKKAYSYTVQLSSRYIVVTAKDSWGRNFHVAERFLIEPWIRSSSENWTSGDDLHAYLYSIYGHHGTQNDSISLENFSVVLQQRNVSEEFFASHPFDILIREPVFVEKVIIYCEDKQSYDVLLIYQGG
jgi:hypothetical protein